MVAIRQGIAFSWVVKNNGEQSCDRGKSVRETGQDLDYLGYKLHRHRQRRGCLICKLSAKAKPVGQSKGVRTLNEFLL